ncbi:MAG: transposase [Chloroflexi bacterium]|jgi:putative transposase|nr:transposase [Chloroflexota bacterium]
MKYDPDKRHRRSIRLKEYDYSQPGAYFLTICTQNREMYLESGACKAVLQSCWCEIPVRYPNVELDEFVIMPNHIHGIMIVGAQFIAPTSGNKRKSALRGAINLAPTIGQMIRSFKATSTRVIRRDILPEFGWQRNYYDHVIRSAHDLYKTRQYIINNPHKWEEDENNPGIITKGITQ